ncbi:hypothetical protein JOB18_033037 [Solea senegalensis]|uniref:SipL SPOCS domain-containing protein n=1 Tax=Solea senegalensis TaxID=28829 RepID=A0AAV6PJ82_SOLSE|nr:hypothetical protein JOB18_033037 [Solea senegalensis]
MAEVANDRHDDIEVRARRRALKSEYYRHGDIGSVPVTILKSVSMTKVEGDIEVTVRRHDDIEVTVPRRHIEVTVILKSVQDDDIEVRYPRHAHIELKSEYDVHDDIEVRVRRMTILKCTTSYCVSTTILKSDDDICSEYDVMTILKSQYDSQYDDHDDIEVRGTKSEYHRHDDIEVTVMTILKSQYDMTILKSQYAMRRP